ncbi:aminoglycoside phosphotransferase [Amycolatopsis antarctica]|uniref:Aminoglycoside phosphotransferase n=1 Tax=Amycolatopsis antarctica TaxID=1854586 RepID=A0A263D9E1_9PSEU|nr:aminoglycoside phosphotransferase family protein [Amycolatopsis antarctica]OZM75134.1 aminoglycoside phosphotransferase [Amycolatopsis antarctica]
MTEPSVPASFARPFALREGAAGRAWLDSVPGLARHYLTRWELELDGEPMHGFAGLVFPVTGQDGTPAVLKLSWPDEETHDEPVALAAWDGDGAVALLRCAPEDGVLLLERLDSGRMLEHEPIGPAVDVIAGLLRRHAIPAPPLRRTLAGEATRWAATLVGEWERLGRPLDRALVDAAVEICLRRGPESASLLVNEDLHFSNVLAGEREPWLVIDPKPLAGDLEFAVIPLLWNRMPESTLDERFAAVTAGAGLDPALALEWTLVRAVVNLLWAVEDEQAGAVDTGSAADPALAGCPRIAEWAHRRILPAAANRRRDTARG